LLGLIGERFELSGGRAAERFDARVLHASISDGQVLEEAEVAQANCLVATTDDDAANLMAMVLGREESVPTLVSVVNDTHHRALFERIGVHVLMDPEAIVARHLYSILRRPGVEDAVGLPGGGFVYELELAEDAALLGRTRESARDDDLLSAGVEIVWVRSSGDEPAPPRPDEDFAVGDRLTVFSPEPLGEKELSAFGSVA